MKEKEFVCKENHCHECAGCGYERPMTKGEKEIADDLAAFLGDADKNWEIRVEK